MADDSEIDYIGTIGGTLDPGSVYPLQSSNDYASAQLEMDAATTNALGWSGDADFYLIARLWTYQPVYRVRWMLEAAPSGPQLRANGTESHPSSVRFILRRFALSDRKQIVTDPADEDRPEMPFRDTLCGLQPALILRQLWGADARTITLSGRGTITFTPETLEFTEPGAVEPTVVDYDTTPVTAYQFSESEGTTRQPALWLARTGAPEGEGWKISFCAEPGKGIEDRWDDPDEPVPPFEPLEVQPPWHW